jgi:ABC-type multidrug transport system ATPase subunit
MTRLTIDDVSYRYPSGRLVITCFSLDAEAGRLYLLRGPNGSGKTSLLSLVAGWLTPTRGRIAREGSLSYVPARLAFHDALTVREELHYLAAAGALARDALLTAAQKWGFTDHELQQEISALSTGWRQRLALAIAGCGQPDIVLLDEPLANLDSEAREMTISWMQERLEDGGVVMMASHDDDPDARVIETVMIPLGRRHEHAAAVA